VRLSPSAGSELNAQCVQHFFFFKRQFALAELEKQIERYIVKFGHREQHRHRLVKRLHYWSRLEQLAVKVLSHDREVESEFEHRIGILFEWLKRLFPVFTIKIKFGSLSVCIVRVRIILHGRFLFA